MWRVASDTFVPPMKFRNAGNLPSLAFTPLALAAFAFVTYFENQAQEFEER